MDANELTVEEEEELLKARNRGTGEYDPIDRAYEAGEGQTDKEILDIENDPRMMDRRNQNILNKWKRKAKEEKEEDALSASRLAKAEKAGFKSYDEMVAAESYDEDTNKDFDIKSDVEHKRWQKKLQDEDAAERAAGQEMLAKQRREEQDIKNQC